ncbi:uncharacterized protein LOC134209451 [Armigeres subalbatus]|uniref:uncharacterized protein LOC134209451 n=1 Tax=Armigeres subalbatus TaxID=124917 RepID=UPI002ED423CF
MVWKPEPDVFVFQGVFREEIPAIFSDGAVPTKREALRTVMSIFDPIGLVAIFVIHRKVLVQHIWRSGLGWDERIADILLEQWKRWVKLLQQLERIEIPRCYFPGYSSEGYRTELHIFVDASEEAFAAVAYFRIVEETRVRCSLVSAKTKDALLKLLSIPRLELSAAVVGARLSKSVIENHTLPISRKTFWSDSCTDMTEIHDRTQVDEWRWVPSRMHVADDATKWGKGPDISSELQTREELLQYERFSKWERLVRAVSYVRRFVDNLRCKAKKQSPSNTEWLNRDELLRAETTVFKQIHHEAFGDGLVILKKNQELPAGEQQRLKKTSKILKLSPFLVEQGRMDGRIADMRERSFLSKHCNAETAINEMSQKFHVSEMRVVFEQAAKQCQWCKIYRAAPEIPRMAPLPQARTVSHVRPFTYVGVDYFGPMLVKQGRSEVKRWVALFTCLTIHTVHLEVVHNLTTESCKMAGGIMVRSVKSALASLSTGGKPDDETLRTLLVEAESIINSRPLTYLPIDSEEQEALTPNCFLMLSTSGVNQPAREPIEEGRTARCNWDLCKQLLDRFWARWIQEYLPTITKRTKWFKTGSIWWSSWRTGFRMAD